MKKYAILAALLLLSVTAARAGEPGLDIWDIYVNVDYAYEGDETLTLFNLPDGTGSPFSEAQLPDGSLTDATLRIQLLDNYYVPVPDFPAEDMWLESFDHEMLPCLGGTTADFNTDADGWTVWATPLHAGGFSTSPCVLYINGMIPVDWYNLDLQFNSGDISGDGQVNLADLSIFAGSFFGDYAFEADFFCDGVINLIDVGAMAHGMGGSCP